MSAEMRRSWLIQRLNEPVGDAGPMRLLAETFSFGGGLRNGGLSGDAMDLLRNVFTFDYMGSAEFEWGAVPETLQALADDGHKLHAFRVEVPLCTVPPSWRVKDDTPPTGTAPVYALCRREHVAQVRQRIHLFAARSVETKELVGLDAALRPDDAYPSRTQGWLELNNGYFFFTSEHMWSATCALFGVDVAAAVRS